MQLQFQQHSRSLIYQPCRRFNFAAWQRLPKTNHTEVTVPDETCLRCVVANIAAPTALDHARKATLLFNGRVYRSHKSVLLFLEVDGHELFVRPLALNGGAQIVGAVQLFNRLRVWLNHEQLVA